MQLYTAQSTEQLPSHHKVKKGCSSVFITHALLHILPHTPISAPTNGTNVILQAFLMVFQSLSFGWIIIAKYKICVRQWFLNIYDAGDQAVTVHSLTDLGENGSYFMDKYFLGFPLLSSSLLCLSNDAITKQQQSAADSMEASYRTKMIYGMEGQILVAKPAWFCSPRH